MGLTSWVSKLERKGSRCEYNTAGSIPKGYRRAWTSFLAQSMRGRLIEGARWGKPLIAETADTSIGWSISPSS